MQLKMFAASFKKVKTKTDIDTKYLRNDLFNNVAPMTSNYVQNYLFEVIYMLSTLKRFTFQLQYNIFITYENSITLNTIHVLQLFCTHFKQAHVWKLFKSQSSALAVFVNSGSCYRVRSHPVAYKQDHVLRDLVVDGHVQSVAQLSSAHRHPILFIYMIT